MSVRKWHVSEALTSFTRLSELIGELTLEEVLKCLELEAASTRRESVMNRLFSRAVELNRQQFIANLKEKFPWHVSSPRT